MFAASVRAALATSAAIWRDRLRRFHVRSWPAEIFRDRHLSHRRHRLRGFRRPPQLGQRPRERR